MRLLKNWMHKSSRDILKNRAGMTIVEVLIAASIMTVVFLAVGKLSLDGMRSARNVESRADESELLTQAKISLRDPETCLDRIRTRDNSAQGKLLREFGLTETFMKTREFVQQVQRPRIGGGAVNVPGLGQVNPDSNAIELVLPTSPSLELQSLQLAQNLEGKRLNRQDKFGPRLKIQRMDLVWERADDGSVPKLKADLMAKVRIVTDRGDVVGLRSQVLEVPLTLKRAQDSPDSPVIGCFAGDAAGTSDKSPYLVVAQTEEEGGHCIGSTGAVIQDCINRLPASGGTVYVKPGVYEIGPLALRTDHVKLMGARGAVLKSAPAAIFQGIHIQGQGVEVDGLAFDLGALRGDQVKFLFAVTGANARITNNRFIASEQVGGVQSAVVVQGASGVTVSENLFSGFKGASTGVISVTGIVEDLRIQNNQFESAASPQVGVNPLVAVTLAASSLKGAKLADNSVRNYQDGVVFKSTFKGIDIQIASNAFSGMGRDAIGHEATNDSVPVFSNLMVSGNSFMTAEGAGRTFLALPGSSQGVQVESNRVVCLPNANDTARGIVLNSIGVAGQRRQRRVSPLEGDFDSADSLQTRISNNTLQGCSVGIEVGLRNATVSGNQIIGLSSNAVTKVGMIISEAALISQNEIRGYNYGIKIQPTQNVSFPGTVITVALNRIFGGGGSEFSCAGTNIKSAVCVDGAGHPPKEMVFSRNSFYGFGPQGRDLLVSSAVVARRRFPLDAMIDWDQNATDKSFDQQIEITGQAEVGQFLWRSIPGSMSYSFAGGGITQETAFASGVDTRVAGWSKLTLGVNAGGIPAEVNEDGVRVVSPFFIKQKGGNVPFACEWALSQPPTRDDGSGAHFSCPAFRPLLLSGVGRCPAPATLTASSVILFDNVPTFSITCSAAVAANSKADLFCCNK